MKPDITSKDQQLFKNHKPVSIPEIIAAEGATAFGRKTGKNNQTLIYTIKELPPTEPFSE